MADTDHITIGSKSPWFKFFPSDWQGDELLAMCSIGARGLLVELLCLMHKATPYGYLLVNTKQPSDADLVRLARVSSLGEVRKLRTELVERGVLSIASDGTIYTRRMVRKARQSAIGKETGALGGNPKLTPPLTLVSDKPLTPPVKGPTNPYGDLQKLEARSQRKDLVRSPEVEEIAGSLMERYAEIFAKCRDGAAYYTSRPNMERDLENARELATGWPSLPRLLEMLEVFLMAKLGDKNIPGTPGQFLHMAPEMDALLRKNGR